jgi:hypothetical protein
LGRVAPRSGVRNASGEGKPVGGTSYSLPR